MTCRYGWRQGTRGRWQRYVYKNLELRYRSKAHEFCVVSAMNSSSAGQQNWRWHNVRVAWIWVKKKFSSSVSEDLVLLKGTIVSRNALAAKKKAALQKEYHLFLILLFIGLQNLVQRLIMMEYSSREVQAEWEPCRQNLKGWIYIVSIGLLVRRKMRLLF